MDITIFPIIPMKRLRHKELKQLSKDHTDCYKWQSQGSNPENLIQELLLFFLILFYYFIF